MCGEKKWKNVRVVNKISKCSNIHIYNIYVLYQLLSAYRHTTLFCSNRQIINNIHKTVLVCESQLQQPIYQAGYHGNQHATAVCVCVYVCVCVVLNHRRHHSISLHTESCNSNKTSYKNKSVFKLGSCYTLLLYCPTDLTEDLPFM